jgi:hypothetical protein
MLFGGRVCLLMTIMSLIRASCARRMKTIWFGETHATLSNARIMARGMTIPVLEAQKTSDGQVEQRMLGCRRASGSRQSVGVT